MLLRFLSSKKADPSTHSEILGQKIIKFLTINTPVELNRSAVETNLDQLQLLGSPWVNLFKQARTMVRPASHINNGIPLALSQQSTLLDYYHNIPSFLSGLHNETVHPCGGEGAPLLTR